MKTNNSKFMKLKRCNKPRLPMFSLWICWIALFTFLIIHFINSMIIPKIPLFTGSGNKEPDLSGPISGVVLFSIIALLGVFGIVNEFKNLFMYNALIKKGKKCVGKVKRAVRHEDIDCKTGISHSKYHLEYQILDADYVPSPVFYSEFLSYDPSSSVGDKCTIYILESKKALNYLVVSE
ncbi:MAG: hypothetical protein IKT78_01410 [Ruminiclostridium sp.]|nr:hypothetical protein [Ruminiclostridium sp.]